jgi:thiol:disulfide interchange protein DsbC
MHGARAGGYAVALLGALLLASPLWSAEDPSASVKRTLQQRYPEAKIQDVQPSAVPGLFEVFTGNAIYYADRTGDYVVMGQLIDTRSKRNLSAERLDARNAIEFRKLPFDRAIKVVKGDGRRELAVFEDPDCPYCEKLEKELRSIPDLTLYVFLYPLQGVHPNATEHARAIWCSPDRSSAWTEWMLDHKTPPGSTCEGDPIAEIQALANNLRVTSTPTLFFASGRRVGGTRSAAELQALLGPADAAQSAVASGPTDGAKQ